MQTNFPSETLRSLQSVATEVCERLRESVENVENGAGGQFVELSKLDQIWTVTHSPLARRRVKKLNISEEAAKKEAQALATYLYHTHGQKLAKGATLDTLAQIWNEQNESVRAAIKRHCPAVPKAILHDFITAAALQGVFRFNQLTPKQQEALQNLVEKETDDLFAFQKGLRDFVRESTGFEQLQEEKYVRLFGQDYISNGRNRIVGDLVLSALINAKSGDVAASSTALSTLREHVGADIFNPVAEKAQELAGPTAKLPKPSSPAWTEFEKLLKDETGWETSLKTLSSDNPARRALEYYVGLKQERDVKAPTQEELKFSDWEWQKYHEITLEA